MLQPTNQAKTTYQPESQLGQDFYCPVCWEKRQVKEVLADLVIKQPDGSEKFEGLYCAHCVDVLKKDTEWHNPANLTGFEIGGKLGYPDD